MPNINSSTNSPRSVAEHPNILSDRAPSNIFQGLSTLPRLLPRNAIAVRLPDFMGQGLNLDQALNISPIGLTRSVNRANTDSTTNPGAADASANGTYVATSRTSNPRGPLPNFPQF